MRSDTIVVIFCLFGVLSVAFLFLILAANAVERLVRRLIGKQVNNREENI